MTERKRKKNRAEQRTVVIYWYIYHRPEENEDAKRNESEV